MDAFENLMAMLLRREGYWTHTGFRVELAKDHKVAIGRPSSPRWEIDLLAYKPGINELLVVECKSYLDSKGVVFRNGGFEPLKRYKLFTEPTLRKVVLRNLEAQLIDRKSILPNATVKLALATGKLASTCDQPALTHHFQNEKWELFDAARVSKMLAATAGANYENDVALVVTKILMRTRTDGAKKSTDRE